MTASAGPLDRAFRSAYAFGLLLCVGLPAGILLWMARAPEPVPQPGALDPGGAFTGMALFLALAVFQRMRRLRAAFPGLPEGERPRRLGRELRLAALLLAPIALLGLAHRVSGAPRAARHAMGFVLLAPCAFLALVPRRAAWGRR